MRSQAAVDFLVSWGWVIIIIVLVLSLLFAFGIFSVPPQPTLINGFQGVDITVASANSSLAVFKISNGAGTPINLDNIVITVSGNSYSALDCFSTSVANGQTVLCRVPVTIKTSSYLMDVSVIYSPVRSQLYLYSNGTISGGVSRGILPLNNVVSYFDEENLPSGSVWSVTYNSVQKSQTVSGSSSFISFSMPFGTYSYSVSLTSTPSCTGVSASPSSGQLATGGTATIFFGGGSCATTFDETGLNTGTSWSVSYDNLVQSSTGTSITFNVPAGKHSFSLPTFSAAGCSYSPHPSSGSLQAGTSQSISYFSSCTTTFTESGLPSGTSWSVTYNSQTLSSTSTSVSFSGSAGSYSYSISSPTVSGCTYSPSPSSGSLTAGQSQAISYSGNCTTTFTESSLPSGTSWSVTYNSVSKSSTGSMTFYDTPGSYSFSVPSISASGCPYSPNPSSGTLTAGQSQAISFSGSCITTFTESGLPSSALWSVNYNGTTLSGTGVSITFSTNYETNLPYSVGDGYYGGCKYTPSPASGTLTTGGSASITYSTSCPITFSVPITVSNSQSSATSNPFQQMITVDSATYASHEAQNLQNVEFLYENGTVIPSWLESGNSTATSTAYWLKLGSIPASSALTIYMGFASTSTNFFNNVNVGEAPQLNIAPVNIVYSAPVTITNSQSSATPDPFQQMINVTNSVYNGRANATFNNVEFFYPNGTVIPSWLESYTYSKNAIYWLKLGSIPASSSMTVYIGFASNSTNLFNTNTVGEAPKLSVTYGEYDDGANVFNFYDNFAGTTINTAVWQEINSGAGSYSQNNGITISETTYKSSTELVSVNEYSGLLEGLVTSQNTGSFRGTGMEIATTLPSSGALQNGYRFMVSTNSEPGSYIQEVKSGTGATIASNSAVPGVPYLLGALWPATGSEIFGDNYASHVSATNSSFSISPYYISLYAGSDGSNIGTIAFQYVRIRAIPPNGIMPSVSFGSVSSLVQGQNYYGEYDDGANVFNDYWNFAGTSLPSGWTSTDNFGSITVNSGLTLSVPGNEYAVNWAYYKTALPPANEVFEADVTSTTYGTAGGLTALAWSVSVEKNSVPNCGLQNTFDGYSIQVPGAPSYRIQESTGANCGSGSPSVSNNFVNGTYNVYGINWQSTGLENAFLDDSKTLQWTNSTVSIANAYPGIGVYENAAGKSQTFLAQWARVRAYPPNGVMPSISFGSGITP